ncbi:hypothetical protein OV450_1333 [Actinobacteria bacterium OV450]|nr:hypothetical protein OV450_1333 [Actinobacteria bacterium OV450]
MPIQPAPIGDPAYSETLPRTAESVRDARQLVLSALHVWGLDSYEDSALLVVTELVANAVVHAQHAQVRVTVTLCGPRRVRIAVVDRSLRMPERCKAEAGDERGRGLEIVEALADVWDVDRLRRGKRVWAELTAPEASPDE